MNSKNLGKRSPLMQTIYLIRFLGLFSCKKSSSCKLGTLLMQVVKKPSEEELEEFVTSEKARKFMRSLPSQPKKTLAQMYPDTSAGTATCD